LQNILVIFEATDESTEGLALALGLGAVQQGANIRLRHLDPLPVAKLAHQSYGRLRAEDLRWAEGIAVVLEMGSPAGIGEIEESLEQLSAKDAPISKVFYVFGGRAAQKCVLHLHERLQQAGFHPHREETTNQAATLARMTEIGQRLAEENI
jgi:hypothetical protein